MAKVIVFDFSDRRLTEAQKELIKEKTQQWYCVAGLEWKGPLLTAAYLVADEKEIGRRLLGAYLEGVRDMLPYANVLPLVKKVKSIFPDV